MRGVYAIRNKVTGECYVGSAECISERWRAHEWSFRRGHSNANLQRAYDAHGANAFAFEVLECVPDSRSLTEREQYYIDTLLPSYNQRQRAIRSRAHTHTRVSNLKAWRTFRGMSQRELATAAGVGLRTITNAEYGSPASEYTVHALASALSISDNELLTAMPPVPDEVWRLYMSRHSIRTTWSETRGPGTVLKRKSNRKIKPNAECVKAWRLHCKLSQRALAESCGISLLIVHRIEHGHVTTQRTLNRLAAALNVRADQLLREMPLCNAREVGTHDDRR